MHLIASPRCSRPLSTITITVLPTLGRSDHRAPELVVFGVGADGPLVVPQAALEQPRTLEQLQALVRDRFGIDTVVLHAGGLNLGEDTPAMPVVLEALGNSAQAPSELADKYLPPNTRPWQRPGWLREARGWLTSILEARGEALVGEVHQGNSYDLACVLYADTSRGGVYLKAGEVGGREATVTAHLAATQPDLAPEVVGWDGPRNWLITRNSGQHLSQSGGLNVWQEALDRLARFHLRADPGPLSALGCPTYTFADLAERAGMFLTDMTALERWGLNAAQREALAALTPFVQRAQAGVAALGLPEGVVHGDAQPMNALVSARGGVWFDWSEASLAHPFLDVGWCLGWLDHPARSDLPLRRAHPEAAQGLWKGYLRTFGIANVKVVLLDVVALAFVHRALAYHERFMTWKGTVPGWFPQYVPYYLRQFIKVTTGAAIG